MTRGLSIGLLMGGLVATAGIAQSPPPRLGPVAGVNFATVSGDDVANTKSRTAFLFGAFAEIPLSRIFSIQPEALYTMKGPKIEDTDINASLKISYVEVPLLLRVNIPTSGSSSLDLFQGTSGGGVGVRPHIYAGPAVAFKASCKLSGEEGSSSLDMTCKEAESDLDFAAFKGLDWSAVFGGGLDIGDFTLGARYTMGLGNIIDQQGSETSDVKHRVFSIYAGYGFRLR